MHVNIVLHLAFRILMHVNIALSMACVTAYFDGRGFAEHQSGRRGQLVNMLITLEPHGIFCILRGGIKKFVH